MAGERWFLEHVSPSDKVPSRAGIVQEVAFFCLSDGAIEVCVFMVLDGQGKRNSIPSLLLKMLCLLEARATMFSIVITSHTQSLKVKN